MYENCTSKKIRKRYCAAQYPAKSTLIRECASAETGVGSGEHWLNRATIRLIFQVGIAAQRESVAPFTACKPCAATRKYHAVGMPAASNLNDVRQYRYQLHDHPRVDGRSNTPPGRQTISMASPGSSSGSNCTMSPRSTATQPAVGRPSDKWKKIALPCPGTGGRSLWPRMTITS